MFLVLVKSTSEDSMAWNESRKLTWNDFKANPKPKSNAAALTASGITFGYSVKTSGQRIIDFSVSVEAHFYPDKSWYLKDKGNAHILKHEQLHFDITELYTRKFKEQLERLVVNQNVKEQMKRLQKALGSTDTVELVTVIAAYNMVSRFLIALDVNPEDHPPA